MQFSTPIVSSAARPSKVASEFLLVHSGLLNVSGWVEKYGERQEESVPIPTNRGVPLSQLC